MTALRIRAQSSAQDWPFYLFRRALFFLMTTIAVFIEARELARAARKRYPFAEW